MAKRDRSPSTFSFKVKGQEGAIPQVGLGTATLFDDVCAEAVHEAIRCGYRAIDTALLYNNQEAVGKGIKAAIDAGDVTREDLWVTTKVGFYPGPADGSNCWVPIEFHQCNRKGKANAVEAVDLCLSKLQLEYADLVLIHNPATEIAEYEASCCPHFFELSKSDLTGEEREMIIQSRLKKVQYSGAAGVEARKETWLGLEQVQKVGKCKFIGVSNYPPPLIDEMRGYATVMPCVNQLELHPRFSSPSLRQFAAANGIVLTGYGTGNSVSIEDNEVVRSIAARLAISAVAVVLCWTLQRGVSVVPRSASPAHIKENLGVLDQDPLSEADMQALDELNAAHPYYWSPMPLLPPGSLKDAA